MGKVFGMSLLVVGVALLVVNSPPQYVEELLGGNKVYLKNRLIINNSSKELKIVYFDPNKEKIELAYNVEQGDDGKPIVKNKLNFFDFFEYDGQLNYLSIIKKTAENIEKEFEEKLNDNGYVAYFDKQHNSLYVFAHNGTKGVNGGRIFYNIKRGEKIKFINSLLNTKEEFIVKDRNILPKQEFIKEFTNNKGVFSSTGSIYLITCYPNYQSYKRLILRLVPDDSNNLTN